jgi:CBS domain-containing protein
LHARRFEISGTTRNKVPIEHIEMALRLAEALGQEQGLRPAPVSANDVEAAYLRRLKVKRAEVLRSGEIQLPRCVEGRLVAVYQARDVVAALLHGGNDFAYVIYSGENVTPDHGVLLRCNPMRGVMVALPVIRGRVMQGSVLMSTPLADLDLKSGDWLRALSAWGAWLTKVTVQRQ